MLPEDNSKTDHKATTGSNQLTMFDLVKRSLRGKHENVIIGWVTEEESFDLIKTMNTGTKDEK